MDAIHLDQAVRLHRRVALRYHLVDFPKIKRVVVEYLAQLHADTPWSAALIGCQGLSFPRFVEFASPDDFNARGRRQRWDVALFFGCVPVDTQAMHILQVVLYSAPVVTDCFEMSPGRRMHARPVTRVVERGFAHGWEGAALGDLTVTQQARFTAGWPGDVVDVAGRRTTRVEAVTHVARVVRGACLAVLTSSASLAAALRAELGGGVTVVDDGASDVYDVLAAATHVVVADGLVQCDLIHDVWQSGHAELTYVRITTMPPDLWWERSAIAWLFRRGAAQWALHLSAGKALDMRCVRVDDLLGKREAAVARRGVLLTPCFTLCQRMLQELKALAPVKCSRPANLLQQHGVMHMVVSIMTMLARNPKLNARMMNAFLTFSLCKVIFDCAGFRSLQSYGLKRGKAASHLFYFCERNTVTPFGFVHGVGAPDYEEVCAQLLQQLPPNATVMELEPE